jgi:hypothetical protein
VLSFSTFLPEIIRSIIKYNVEFYSISDPFIPQNLFCLHRIIDKNEVRLISCSNFCIMVFLPRWDHTFRLLSLFMGFSSQPQSCLIILKYTYNSFFFLIISSLRGDGCLQSNALLSGRARVKIQVNPCACVDIVSYHLQHSQIYSDEIFLLVHRTVCMLNRRGEYISQTGYRNILLFFQKNRFRIMGIVFFAKRIMGIVELIIYGFPRKPAQLFCFCHLFFAYYT